MELFKTVSISKVENNKILEKSDIVINEKLYSIKINKEVILSLYCLPIHLEELVQGILYQEKVISRPDSIVTINIDNKFGVIDIFLKTTDINLENLNRLKKTKFITPDCTNPTAFSHLYDDIIYKPVNSNMTLELDKIFTLMKQFNGMSELYKNTGGTHSAALCSTSKILFYNEDISRHNCIDKLIGWAFSNDVKLQDKIFITTGRISATMVIKALKVSLPILISRSAPTWESIKIANNYKISLIGFVRGRKLNIYTHPERFLI